MVKYIITVCLTLGVSSAQVTLTDATGAEITINDTSRVITLGGEITEIVYALDGLYMLGFGPRVGQALKDLALDFYLEVTQN